MLGRNRWWKTVRVLFSFLMAAVLVCGLVSCGDSRREPPTLDANKAAKTQIAGSLSEVAPPPVIQQLSQSLDAYQPQVTIVSPSADEVLQDTTVSVQLQVQDLPVFKDPNLDLGPHLHVILDNQPYQAVYDLDQPLVFEDLAPGTHTLRVFASRPWHESFKNEGAYAQATFHIFTKTPDNNPDPALPLLTYSRPKGSYGAEPILLDFYLTNAPLHLVAQESPNDEIADWRIRVTVNGQSFVLDRWQPVYLQGFKPGKNWLQIEFLDEQGNPVKNVFNNTVRLITYEPKGKDTLSKLVRGELSAEAARGIVGTNLKVEPTPTPSPEVTPSPSPSPTITPLPIPSVEETQTSEPATPEEELTPPAELTPTEPLPSEKPKSGGFFNRFRRPEATPSPSPELPEELEAPSPAPVVPEEPEQTPEPEQSVAPSESSTAVEEPTPTEPIPLQKPKPGGFFNRFRRPEVTPSPSPELPEELETPSPAPVVPEEPEQTLEPETTANPSEPPATVEEPTPAQEFIPTEPLPSEKPKPGGFFNRFRRPVVAPNPSPNLSGELEAPSSKPTVVPSPEPEPETTSEPEGLVTPSESPSSKEEPTSEVESVPKVEPTPVIEPMPVRPIQPEKLKAHGFFKRSQRPAIDEVSPESGVPPTLPEIVETPFLEPSEPEATFPQPKPLIDPEPESSTASP